MIIAILIAWPLLMGIIALLRPQWARGVGIWGAALELVLALLTLGAYSLGIPTEMQAPLLAQAGIYFALALDGASVILILTAAITTLLAILVAREAPRGMFGMSLLMLAGLVGIFTSQDLVLFYFFFEATLIPSLLMLGLYGGAGRLQALLKFALFTLVGSLLMLASILSLRFLSGAESFLLTDLLAAPISGSAAAWVFAGFLLAFFVKAPLFPLHAWLPDFHAENHPSGLADAMGTLYKVGLFGMFRFALPLFPETFAAWQPVLLGLAAFTALYAAWIAYSQTDWKRLLAYGSLSHIGLAALGLFSGTWEGALGAIFLLAASGIYTGGLFLFVGMLHSRFGSTEIAVTQGLLRHTPALGAFALILILAMVGLPGLAGFPGELMSLLGAWQVSPLWTAVGFLAVIASAAYALSAYQKVFHGPPAEPSIDLSRAEWNFAGLATVFIVLIGVYPKLMSGVIEPSARAFAGLVGGGL